jgi:hypothetical protein
VSGNIEWRQVLSLLEAAGTATQEPNGKVKVELGGETMGTVPCPSPEWASLCSSVQCGRAGPHRRLAEVRDLRRPATLGAGPARSRA